MKREGGRQRVILSRYLFYCFFLFVCFVCPVLSRFINFIFDSFVISYSMDFVAIERKKTLLKKRKLYKEKRKFITTFEGNINEKDFLGYSQCFFKCLLNRTS